MSWGSWTCCKTKSICSSLCRFAPLGIFLDSCNRPEVSEALVAFPCHFVNATIQLQLTHEYRSCFFSDRNRVSGTNGEVLVQANIRRKFRNVDRVKMQLLWSFGCGNLTSIALPLSLIAATTGFNTFTTRRSLPSRHVTGEYPGGRIY